MLLWSSTRSGTFEARVTIDGEVVGRSPVAIKLTSRTPELNKTEMAGPGLQAGIVGQPSKINFHFFDTHGNPAQPYDSFGFGIAIEQQFKKRVNDAKASEFEGSWLGAEGDDTGEYTMTYVPTTAGFAELHVWCDPQAKGERLPFLGSPFNIHIAPGSPTSEMSYVDGGTQSHARARGGSALPVHAVPSAHDALSSPSSPRAQCTLLTVRHLACVCARQVGRARRGMGRRPTRVRRTASPNGHRSRCELG